MTEHRYPVSKLLQAYPCRELATRARQSGKSNVIINYLNPGLCHSELSRESGLALTILKFLFARTTEHGSRSLVSAVEGGEETNGQYLSDCEIEQYVQPHHLSRNIRNIDMANPYNYRPGLLVRGEEGPQTQTKVWNELSAKLEKIQPGIMNNI